MSPQPIKTNERPLFVKTLIKSIVALQVIFVATQYLLTPGYIVPFFKNSIGRYIWIACAIWEIIGFALLYRFCPRREVFAVTAATLVVLLNAGPLTLWPLIGPVLATIVTIEGPYMGSDDVSSVAFSSDRKMLASDSSDNSIKLLDVGSGKELRALVGHSKLQRAEQSLPVPVAFSPDGKLLASGSGDRATLWDVASGKELRTLNLSFVVSVAFSPDSKTLAGGDGNTIYLWDVSSSKELSGMAGNSGPVLTIAFSPDGKTLAAGSFNDNNNNIKLWDVPSGKELRTLKGHPGFVESVAFSPDGKTLASGSADHTIKLWDVTSGQELHTLATAAQPFLQSLPIPFLWLGGHSDTVKSVTFSPDGKTLASGSLDKTIKLWDVASGKELCTLSGNSEPVFSVAFSPDGKTLYSDSKDNTIKIWDIASGKELRTRPSHSE